MKKFAGEKNKILCFVVIIMVVVGIGFYYHKKVERKYQACRAKCLAESKTKTILEKVDIISSQYWACLAGCREKYGK